MKLGFVIVSCLAGVACTAPAVEATSSQTSQAITMEGEVTSPATSPSLLAPGEGFCFLTKVSGKLQEAADGVTIFGDDRYGSWAVRAQNLDDSASAHVRCVRYTEMLGFLAPRTTLSGVAWDHRECWGDGTCTHEPSRTLGLTTGTSFCFLSAFSGTFEGGGERAWVERDASGSWTLDTLETMPRVPTDYQSHTVEYGSVSANAMCVQGTAPGVSFIGDEFTWVQGEPLRPMAPVADAFCFLTSVAGKFMGAGEGVAIESDGANWVLGGWSLQEGVSASARCVAYDQSGFVRLPGPVPPFGGF